MPTEVTHNLYQHKTDLGDNKRNVTLQNSESSHTGMF